MATPRTPKPPLTIEIVIPEGAPLTEEEWTAEQEADAIRGLTALARLLDHAPEPESTEEAA